MRIQNEQSGSSSLFAQPMALEAVPEEAGTDTPGTRDEGPGLGDRIASSGNAGDSASAKRAARTMLEVRIEAVLAELESETEPRSATERQGHLALLKRWYYRPEVKREGEVCFPDQEGGWTIRQILRAVGRVAAKSLATTKAR
jgi:hypothetical protein